MMTTGAKIRLMRTQRKISQQEMADALDVTQRAYSKIETGEVQLKIDRLEKIAQLLNTEVSNLIATNGTTIFKQVQYSQIGDGQFINQVNEKERELYENIIKRQQDEIDYLKGIVSVLK